MREIKFRGKDLKTNEWVYGNLSHYETEKDAMIECITYDYKKLLVTTHFVNLDTIGQFTGMHDDDGTEIWEGDIVRMTEKPYNLEYIGKVTYNAELGCYRLVVDKGNRSMRLNFIKSDIANEGNARVPVKYFYKIIGNIHDNPELLNK